MQAICCVYTFIQWPGEQRQIIKSWLDIWQLVWQNSNQCQCRSRKGEQGGSFSLPHSLLSCQSSRCSLFLSSLSLADGASRGSVVAPKPPTPLSPLQGWERGQVSVGQDMLHQQRPWHSCRPGLYSAGVVWGCLDRRGAPGYCSFLLVQPAYLWLLGGVQSRGVGGVWSVSEWLYQWWPESQTCWEFYQP